VVDLQHGAICHEVFQYQGRKSKGIVMRKETLPFLNTAGKKQIWTILKKKATNMDHIKKKALEIATSLSKSALVTFPTPVLRMHYSLFFHQRQILCGPCPVCQEKMINIV